MTRSAAGRTAGGRERAGEVGGGVRADRVERDVPEVEQAGVADHDVETEREQHVRSPIDVREARPYGAMCRGHSSARRSAGRGSREAASAAC